MAQHAPATQEQACPRMDPSRTAMDVSFKPALATRERFGHISGQELQEKVFAVRKATGHGQFAS
eukprot:12348227-Alexandrium_andersonii.AAC.1